MDNRPIGFFDSGVGGLTCVRALQKLLPNERVVFFGDTARTPYGSKSPETIKRFSFQIVDYLMQYDVKMIVIACNTISATCLDALRERYPQVPIVGIIEPIANKIVAEVTEDIEIGVIATKATVKSGVYEKLIRPRNEHVKLYSKACPVLVPLIEEGIVDNEIMDLTLKHYLDDFIRDNHLKKLVLGCTHYPFLKKNFGRIYPEIDLLNPSKEVIYEVERILRERDMLADEQNAAEHLCYASDLSENFHNVVARVFEDDREVKLEFKKFGD